MKADAGLSSLGLGRGDRPCSIGAVCCASQPLPAVLSDLAVFPGLIMMLAVLGFNAMGDAIRDILAPRMLNRVRGGRTT